MGSVGFPNRLIFRAGELLPFTYLNLTGCYTDKTEEKGPWRLSFFWGVNSEYIAPSKEFYCSRAEAEEDGERIVDLLDENLGSPNEGGRYPEDPDEMGYSYNVEPKSTKKIRTWTRDIYSDELVDWVRNNYGWKERGLSPDERDLAKYLEKKEPDFFQFLFKVQPAQYDYFLKAASEPT